MHGPVADAQIGTTLVLATFPRCHIDRSACISRLWKYENRSRRTSGMGSIFPSVRPGDYRAVRLLMSRWLGQNSKQGKLGRQLTDIQIRMRLRASGSRQEIRETYMPMLASKIVSPLTEKGSVRHSVFLCGFYADLPGRGRRGH